MADWNPALYSRYEDERTRPARELLARVPLATPRWVVDLGCGPGNSTVLLVQRFPDARVTGIDNSPAMLESARQRLPGVAFSLADIASWRAGHPVDVILANASLQWLPDHAQHRAAVVAAPQHRLRRQRVGPEAAEAVDGGGAQGRHARRMRQQAGQPVGTGVREGVAGVAHRAVLGGSGARTAVAAAIAFNQ